MKYSYHSVLLSEADAIAIKQSSWLDKLWDKFKFNRPDPNDPDPASGVVILFLFGTADGLRFVHSYAMIYCFYRHIDPPFVLTVIDSLADQYMNAVHIINVVAICAYFFLDPIMLSGWVSQSQGVILKRIIFASIASSLLALALAAVLPIDLPLT